MSPADIQKALDAIESVRARVLKSPEASRKFLIDAGIIQDTKKAPRKKKTK